ncbi:aspartyl beta-hydroxylase [Pseudomonas syringae KCTC 12500]|uniref:Aspartyl beta-hydroxylase n=1 Tax=Pseudomonas syringae CC1557 TaxID=1357279 RepID=W0MRR5_PSESX|nr:aspartyl/asparaginyl beta-hydroxylase domain-containing protein [Pseudomonas syringae]AHG41264.1 aspartyl beta-hydroxylase [Pseudomonas syringae CC1557]KMY04085.1 aspartyl beta-hydroxylase [Pseudomonas syringae KCTC 12500]PBP83657.1 aspartyl beta-hydroxylase [Pseudomonas syringae]PBQ12312.1 aspartyl beta-hydroxylase [Pseudomonas syringae]POR87394.1 aspartyl beta-hydroxylase [Pseudomonas syringae pv. syringae]
MRPSFYEPHRFPQLQNLADNWEVIREEFLALDAPTLSINRVGKSITQLVEELNQHMAAGGEYGWLWGWGDGDVPMPEWTQYALMAYDQPIPYAQTAMPRTLELLSQIPGVKLCALLRMEPNVFIVTHSHGGTWEEGLLHMQLTIDAPIKQSYAYLNVNGKFNHSTNGNLVIFDGSLDHFAVNAAEEEYRTVMYLEFDREKHMIDG